MTRVTAFQRLEAQKTKPEFEPESMTKEQLVRIVRRAMENPEDFPFWIRREMSAVEGGDSLDREMRTQIQEVFGDPDCATDTSGLIASMEDAVKSGRATGDQGLTWAVEALDVAEEAIMQQSDNDWEIQGDIDSLCELAIRFLRASNLTGKDLAKFIVSLNDRESATPFTNLTGFDQRLGQDGLACLRAELERNTNPDHNLLTQIYALQNDDSAWIDLQLSSFKEEDQIAALDKIKALQSSQKAIERAAAHLNAPNASRNVGFSVRQWWYRERFQAGDDPAEMAQDAWAVFERNPCSQDAWKMLEEWSRHAENWDTIRSHGLELLAKRETGKEFDHFRIARIRIARDEGRERDAWEIARLGLGGQAMEEAIFRAVPHWPAEALTEFDKLVGVFFVRLEHTNNQSFYQMFADLLRRGKNPFGAQWLAGWKEKVIARFARRPKLLEIMGKM